jgi:hypothetical protein
MRSLVGGGGGGGGGGGAEAAKAAKAAETELDLGQVAPESCDSCITSKDQIIHRFFGTALSSALFKTPQRRACSRGPILLSLFLSARCHWFPQQCNHPATDHTYRLTPPRHSL